MPPTSDLPLVVLAALIVSGLDSATTAFLVKREGPEVESDPINRWLLKRYGLAVSSAIYTVVVPLCAVATLWLTDLFNTFIFLGGVALAPLGHALVISRYLRSSKP